jgi:hypothetical protein
MPKFFLQEIRLLRSYSSDHQWAEGQRVLDPGIALSDFCLRPEQLSPTGCANSCPHRFVGMRGILHEKVKIVFHRVVFETKTRN